MTGGKMERSKDQRRVATCRHIVKELLQAGATYRQVAESVASCSAGYFEEIATGEHSRVPKRVYLELMKCYNNRRR